MSYRTELERERRDRRLPLGLRAAGSRDRRGPDTEYSCSYGTPPPSDPYGQPTPLSPGGRLPSGKGFFGALFDFSFEHFVTPMIVKVVYVLAIVALALGFLIFLATSFSQSAGAGVVVLVLGPIAIVLYLCLIRMTLEFYLAVTRMSQDIHHAP